MGCNKREAKTLGASNILYLYLEGPLFKLRPRLQLSLFRVFVVYLTQSSANRQVSTQTQATTDYCQILSNSSFLPLPTIPRYRPIDCLLASSFFVCYFITLPVSRLYDVIDRTDDAYGQFVTDALIEETEVIGEIRLLLRALSIYR
jgi:hypothetical protein